MTPAVSSSSNGLPSWFTVAGLPKHDGKFIQEGPLVNGMPAFVHESMSEQWCCYDAKNKTWCMQSRLNKGSGRCLAHTRGQDLDTTSWRHYTDSKWAQLDVVVTCGHEQLNSSHGVLVGSFSLSGFSSGAINGTFVQSGPLVNGMPAFLLQGAAGTMDSGRWCCYDLQHQHWKIQITEHKGQEKCSARSAGASSGFPWVLDRWEEQNEWGNWKSRQIEVKDATVSDLMQQVQTATWMDLEVCSNAAACELTIVCCVMAGGHDGQHLRELHSFCLSNGGARSQHTLEQCTWCSL